MWYLMEVAALRDAVSHKGFVRIVWGEHNSTMCWNFDYRILLYTHRFLREVWPIKVVADHILGVPQFIVRALKPVAWMAKGKRLRSRTMLHVGLTCFDDLSTCGILKEMLPVEMGGGLKFDWDEWISDRIASEMEMEAI